MKWQSFQNDMSLGHLFDPIFINHYIICNVGIRQYLMISMLPSCVIM